MDRGNVSRKDSNGLSVGECILPSLLLQHYVSHYRQIAATAEVRNFPVFPSGHTEQTKRCAREF